MSLLANKIIVGSLSFKPGSSKKFCRSGEFGVQVLMEYLNLGIDKELIWYVLEQKRLNLVSKRKEESYVYLEKEE